MAVSAMRRDINPTICHGEDVLLEELSSRLKGVLPVQPSPLLVPSDNSSSSLKSTVLDGHLISCFVIGGECRLCFPQIISVVLQDVKVDDVNDLFVDLNIHISVASQQQLDTLKLAGVMPMTADSCGLVTKSDAERLVAKLLPRTSGPLRKKVCRDDAVPICHDCFGGCSGLLLGSIDGDECIECSECKYMFSGEKFVAHTHSLKEIRRVCHWGFDSANWKYYLRIAETHESDIHAIRLFEHFKNPHLRLGKRHNDCKLLYDSDGLPLKIIGLEAQLPQLQTAQQQQKQSLYDLQQLMTQRATMIPQLINANGASTSSMLNVATTSQMCSSLPPQLQSIFALQLAAAAASQLPLNAATSASCTAQAQAQQQQQQSLSQSQQSTSMQIGSATTSSKSTLDISPLSRLQEADSIACGMGSDHRLIKPVAVKNEVCLMGDDPSGSLGKKLTASSDFTLSASINPLSSALSLEKLLEENLKEPVLSVAKMLLVENNRAEIRKRDELSAQIEQLRCENCILRSALSRNPLCLQQQQQQQQQQQSQQQQPIQQALNQKASIC